MNLINAISKCACCADLSNAYKVSSIYQIDYMNKLELYVHNICIDIQNELENEMNK